MSGDYKWDIQCIAEQLAQSFYQKDFCDLSDDAQYQVYIAAEREYRDRMADCADYLRKAEREK